MSDPADYRPRQRRALALVRAALPGVEIEPELAIPEASRALDAVFDVAEPSDAWGIVRADLAARSIHFEHYSTPPSAAELTTTLLKATWVLEQWTLGRRSSARAPLSFVISLGRPVSALEHLGFVAEAIPGCYRARLGKLEVLLVDVRALPRRPGTSFLRAFDDEEDVALENMRALFGDPTVQEPIKIAIREVMMAQPGLWSEALRDLSGEELIELGRQEGFERGQQEGVELGRLLALRDTLARLLQLRLGSVPEPLAAAIASCDDAAALERARDQAMSAPEAGLAAAVAAALAPRG